VALLVANTAPAGSFSEALDAGFSSHTGNATTNAGSIVDLAAGASNGSALSVSVDNSAVGARTGSVTLAYFTDGTGANGHSGLAAVNAGSQTLNVSGNVYRLASASSVTPSPVTLANQRVGGSLTQALTLTNTAAVDGFSESLNATISASGAATASGSFSLLAAGSASSALQVGIDTTSAGAKSGTATITLASDGSGTSGFTALALASQNVAVSGNVYRLASASSVTPSPVTLANQRVGGSLTQALTLTNTAAVDGFSESLNATISASGAATASGSFSLLAAGSASSALQVGVDTTSAGAKSGTATLALVSDGSGTSGFTALALASQNVAVSGNVYRLATPQVDTTPIVLVARLGDASPTRSIGLSNNAPDLYTERLNGSIASTPVGFGSSGVVTGLVPNASSSALGVGLLTTTAGSFSGNASVALVSSGAGTTNAPDQALLSANVALTGRVYAPAAPQLLTPTVNFGIVRVGEVVTARTVSVANGASGALTDTLSASLSGATSPFTAGGNFTGLVAGSTNAASLTVQLATASAGQFSTSADLTFSSHNAEMAPLNLAAGSVSLLAQVNNVAAAALGQTAGSATLGHTGTVYTLNFGTIDQGSSAAATLSLGNAAAGAFADALAGSWDLTGLASAFSLNGFASFANLAAGSALADLSVNLLSTTVGSFDSTLVLHTASTNASQSDLALDDITLHLQGSVAAVPEPDTYLMMLSGMLTLGWAARRARRLQRHAA
jgi:hypothetical protein